MAQSFDTERDRAAGRADPGVIEKGWLVYDALRRPVGNVTDVEGGELRVDGRPESLGFFEVPMSAIRDIQEGEVHLSIQMEALRGDSAETEVTSMSADEEVAHAPGSTGEIESLPGGRVIENGETVVVSAGRREDGAASATSTDSRRASADNEPTEFRGWEDDPADGQSLWARVGIWLAAAGAGAAGLMAFIWWRRRRARRTPLERVRDALLLAGESVEPIWERTREDKRTWWLAPLAALPLILSLRSSKGGAPIEAPDLKPGDALKAGFRQAADTWDTVRQAGRGDAESLKDRLQSVRLEGMTTHLTDRLREGVPARLSDRLPGGISARPTKPVDDGTSDIWWIAVPIVGAAGVAWLATRERGRTRRQLGDIMTREVQVVLPDATVAEVADMMKRLDIGAVPVCDGRRLQGMVTDRDIVVRGVAGGRDLRSAEIKDVMSPHVVFAFADDSAKKGADLMRQHQIRRLPIVDRDQNLVGVVSLGDLAVDLGNEALSAATLEQVSAPAPPNR